MRVFLRFFERTKPHLDQTKPAVKKIREGSNALPTPTFKACTLS